ncbi:MAG: extracellular solute-binding protein [Quadrisphaera sp.]
MDLSRRDLIRAGGVAAFAAFATSACSNKAASGVGGGSSDGTTLWYWGGGLSDKVVANAATQFPDAKIKASVIGGDFKQKLQTTLAGGRFIPTITGVKGEDMPYFRSVSDKFTDLGPLGASALASSGLQWKWDQAKTEDGKQIGFPIDVGPTAMFYRNDLFAQAGLPSEPDAVSAATTTWDAFFALGQELHAKIPTAFPISQLATLWDMVTGQTSQRFIDKSGKFVGDSDEMRQAWETTVKAQALGLNANASQSLNQALSSGAVAAEPGAAWHAPGHLPGSPRHLGQVARGEAAGQGHQPRRLVPHHPGRHPGPGDRLQDHRVDPQPRERGPGLHRRLDLPGGPRRLGAPGAHRRRPPSSAARRPSTSSARPPRRSRASTRRRPTPLWPRPTRTQLSQIETSGKDPEQAWKDAVAAAKDVFARSGGQS